VPRPKKPKAAEGEQPSRAEMIRQTARALGKRVRPRDIIATLKDKGVTVSHTLVSKTLHAAGFRRKRQPRGRKAAGTTSATPALGNGLNVEALIAAKALIAKVGSVGVAEEALKVLKKLG
jgi:hypothetical protein